MNKFYTALQRRLLAVLHPDMARSPITHKPYTSWSSHPWQPAPRKTQLPIGCIRSKRGGYSTHPSTSVDARSFYNDIQCLSYPTWTLLLLHHNLYRKGRCSDILAMSLSRPIIYHFDLETD
eukprot:626687-Pleurochrysis_carterae.AAC.5